MLFTTQTLHIGRCSTIVDTSYVLRSGVILFAFSSQMWIKARSCEKPHVYATSLAAGSGVARGITRHFIFFITTQNESEAARQRILPLSYEKHAHLSSKAIRFLCLLCSIGNFSSIPFSCCTDCHNVDKNYKSTSPCFRVVSKT